MTLTITDALTELEPKIRANKLIIFVGSGISVGSGMPSWDATLTKLIDFCESIQSLLPANKQFKDLLIDARGGANNQTVIASVLKRKLVDLAADGYDVILSQFKIDFTKVFTSGIPHRNHELIVDTKYPFILTTNYDNLLMEAAKAKGYLDLWKNWYSYTQAAKVAAAIYREDPSIIHLHGTVTDIVLDDFVFTAEDYINVSRRFPGFTLAIQSLFMRYSILFVGYGGTDPHLEEFMKEIAFWFNWPKYPEFPMRYYITLPKAEIDHVVEAFSDTLLKEVIALNNYGDVTTLLEELQRMSPR